MLPLNLGSGYFAQKTGLSESTDSATSCSDYPSCAKFFDCKISLRLHSLIQLYLRVFCQKLSEIGFYLLLNNTSSSLYMRGCGNNSIRVLE